MILNKFYRIFAFCIKQTRNQDLKKPEIILFYDNIDEKPYILRTSFASHSLENERVLRSIPKFLEQSCSKTMGIYTNAQTLIY